MTRDAMRSMAVQLFSKNVHDPTFPVTIQNISCKLLLNLMESIRVKTEQDLTVSIHMGVAFYSISMLVSLGWNFDDVLPAA